MESKDNQASGRERAGYLWYVVVELVTSIIVIARVTVRTGPGLVLVSVP